MTSLERLRSALLFSHDAVTSGERAALTRGANRRELVRIAPGAYLPAAVYDALDALDRHRALILATCGRGGVVSHGSAAILHGMPWVGPVPHRVHVAAPRTGGGRSTVLLARHDADPAQVECVAGIHVTTLARTVVDLARTARLDTALVVADAALAGAAGRPAIRPAELEAEAAAVPMRQGAAKARFVAAFASGLSGSPGESVSRLSIHRAGFPAPVLQQEFRRRYGGRWLVDFWWPEAALIGEFDGRAKYSDPRYLAGRTPADVVYEEKLREDELRASGPRFTRWDWRVASSVPLLAAHLQAAGLRQESRGRRGRSATSLTGV